MENQSLIWESTVKSVLELYGFPRDVREQKVYINYNGEHGDGLLKVILSVCIGDDRRVVIKMLRESEGLDAERDKIERQSIFSEKMRSSGIRTPRRYMLNGRYCNQIEVNGRACNVTVEDWCGEELTLINPEIAFSIGSLMGRMHRISLENQYEIGCGTLFSAAYWNDVDAYSEFCRICEDCRLDQMLVEQIKANHDEKLDAIRSVWERLPKAAVQGDISINNLVWQDRVLTVFDYNNAGDEVLVSDLVLEGLLTAYEMDLPDGESKEFRENLFPAFLKGYLSVRRLSELEAETAWNIFTLYDALWFTKIVYQEDSLAEMVKRHEFDRANGLLRKILADLTKMDDGRFRGLFNAV